VCDRSVFRSGSVVGSSHWRSVYSQATTATSSATQVHYFDAGDVSSADAAAVSFELFGRRLPMAKDHYHVRLPSVSHSIVFFDFVICVT